MSGYQKLNTMIEADQEERSVHIFELQSRAGLNKNRIVVSSGVNQVAAEAHDIRQAKYNFRDYYKNQELSNAAYDFSEKLLNGDLEEKMVVVKQMPSACMDFFVSILSRARKEGVMRYVLTLLSDLTEVETITQIFVKDDQAEVLIVPLLKIMYRNDSYCKFQACLIVARLAAHSKCLMKQDELSSYLSFIITNLSCPVEYLESVSRALMSFLRKEQYRMPFFEAHGVKPILDVLDKKISFQLQYQLIFCLWNLSFEADVVEKMKEYPIAVVLCDVLRYTNREKVHRVIFATFRNLLEKSSPSVSTHYATQMIHFKAVPVLNIMIKQTKEDSDLQDDMEFLHSKLNTSLQDLSSFDEYAAEVRSGRLEWSPVHRSDKFWRENVMRLNENNHEILRKLVAVLKETKSTVALAVAAHDLGEYVRYYPRGKKAVDNLGAKEEVMKLVNNGNSDVKMQALLAIQKMMVQNWEYLGKQLTEGAAN